MPTEKLTHEQTRLFSQTGVHFYRQTIWPHTAWPIFRFSATHISTSTLRHCTFDQYGADPGVHFWAILFIGTWVLVSVWCIDCMGTIMEMYIYVGLMWCMFAYNFYIGLFFLSMKMAYVGWYYFRYRFLNLKSFEGIY